MRISVIGAGYVGLVSGACFSEFGFTVTCVEKDKAKIARLLKDDVPIYEPGLEAMLRRNREAGRLSFTNDLAGAVKTSDVVIIAVGTPTGEHDGAADMTYVEAAAREIAENLDGFTVVVTKSTVPVGSGRRLKGLMAEVNPQADFEIVSNPEFLREGTAIDDFMKPDRIVIGIQNPRAQGHMQELYKPLSHLDTPVLFTDIESSELTKYAANSFLAMKVTYINQIADLCEALGANAHDVAKGIGLDDRIGPRFLKPGPGIGGSCFPKDTQALTAIAREVNKPISIIDTVVEANNARKRSMATRIIEIMGNDLKGKTIGVLGVSFKPDTDDMREAPSLDIIPLLQQAGADICAYDPAAMTEAARLMPGVEWGSDAYSVARNADALVILTEWNEFKALDLAKIAQAMKQALLIDLRSIYALEEISATPFIYHSIGRPTVLPQKLEVVQTDQG